ncbi:MAG: hypothetical protein F6J90_13520 [Moorea sp. SIOASIH]|nr:hypothetical protein [Moorena sp. SIOASIH]
MVNVVSVERGVEKTIALPPSLARGWMVSMESVVNVVSVERRVRKTIALPPSLARGW